jgi:monofunctional biosynthetic peptidoglycan transglycosylase
MLKRHTHWFIVLSFFLILFPIAYLLLMPDLSKFKKENPKKTALMEYRERAYKEKKKRYRIDQSWVALSEISPYLVKAVLIAEDDKFWRHEGFDYEAIQKAIEKDLKAKKFKSGGSTITQQLARNLFLSPEKSLIRKISEAVIAWRMEKVLSKKRILELYLNVAEWGEGIFGVDAASRYYYGKSSSELTPEEAARLAAILPNPRRYSPFGDQRYVINRSNLIYSIMIQRGIVIPEYKEIYQEVTGGLESSSPEEINSYAPVSKEEGIAKDK